MNYHCINVGKYTGNAVSVDYPKPFSTQTKSIMLIPTTPYEIHKIIANLDNGSAAGYDGIKALPLKYTSQIISPILSHLISSMLETGEFPDDLKVAS